MVGMATRDSQNKQTLQSLSVTLQTVGRMQATFSQVQLFWSAVAKQSTTLAGMSTFIAREWDLGPEDLKEDSPFEVIADSFTESAIRWAAVGSVNLKAHKSILEAKKSGDTKLDDLPDGEVRGVEVDRLVEQLLVNVCSRN